jgi:hypothetical protein
MVAQFLISCCDISCSCCHILSTKWTSVLYSHVHCSDQNEFPIHPSTSRRSVGMRVNVQEDNGSSYAFWNLKEVQWAHTRQKIKHRRLLLHPANC